VSFFVLSGYYVFLVFFVLLVLLSFVFDCFIFLHSVLIYLCDLLIFGILALLSRFLLFFGVFLGGCVGYGDFVGVVGWWWVGGFGGGGWFGWCLCLCVGF